MAEFERLRALLLDPERQRLDALEAARDGLPQALPAALEAAARGADAERLARALAEPVAGALGSAVREQRQTIVDALFPIIGPAIRKAIAEALRDFTEGFNRALESSLTPRGLRWRLEAWRSGLPYAQVVLRHTLRCRIDHLFLIERETGLVLHHAAAPDLPDLDADAIAGMLTAIGDFVRDSLRLGGGAAGSLASATVGEHLLWVIEGPRANLAAFLRGVPPPALHAQLEQALERLHAELDNPLQGLQAGAADAGAAFAAALDPGALERAAVQPERPGRGPSRPWPLLLALLLPLLLVLVWAAWRGREAQRWQARVQSLGERVRATPGYLLTAVEDIPCREIVLRGARDPDAPPPEGFLAPRPPGCEAAVRFEFQPVLSLAPAIVAARARRLLAPPPRVVVEVDAAARLSLRGAAPAAWIAAARAQAAWVPGVSSVDDADLHASDAARGAARAELARLDGELAGLRVAFAPGGTGADDSAALVAIAERLRRALALAGPAGLQVRAAIHGGNDASGNEAVNAPLRRARAEWLRAALVQAGLPAEALQFAPDDALVPPTAAATLPQRSAHVRLILEEADAKP